MRRDRLLRWLLLALLVPFLVLIAVTLRRPAPRGEPPQALPPEARTRAEQIEVVHVEGQRASLNLVAERVEAAADGSLRLEGVQRLELAREAGPPLRVRAAEGGVTGAPGQHRLELRGGVELVDEARELLLTMDGVVVEEAAMQARSVGEVRFASGPYRGRARGVLYPLDAQPIVLEAPEIDDGHGGLVRAEVAQLAEGARAVRLEGHVRLERAGSWIEAERVELVRDETGRLREAVLEGRVQGAGRKPPTELEAQRLELAWDAQGQFLSARCLGKARVRQGKRRLAAERIEATRLRAGWSLEAAGGVDAAFDGVGEATGLEAEALAATFDLSGELRSGSATGQVRLRGRGLEGEAAQVRLEGSRAVLEADGALRARVAQGPFRVAAERITLERDGTWMTAERRVEATRLAWDAGGDWFADAGPVHFVAQRLEGEPRAGRVVFEGAVRAWQEERTLAAQRVSLDDPDTHLAADGQVRTRLPRSGGPVLGEQDFLEVQAAALDYDGRRAVAVYQGQVRLRVAEGWMEASYLELERGAEGAVRELRAADHVRFEFRAPAEDGLPVPVEGTGDRLRYDPATGWVELYGERVPAQVQRQGPAGERTEARVIRYQLQTGALDVAAGARVRTGSSPP